MKKALLFILFSLILIIGTGIAVHKMWPIDTPVQAEEQIEIVTTSNHTAHTNMQSRRQTSMPTECFDDNSPSICAGIHDVVKTEQNNICNCKTVHNGKTYVKQYNVKATYEYTLGFGEDNAIVNVLDNSNICDAVCENFSTQIAQGKFLPREYFTITTQCEDAKEIPFDDETRYYSQCKCMISDEFHTPTWFDMARVKHNEFTEKTPEQAVSQCNRWCGRLCDTVFSGYIEDHPEFELINEEATK